MQRVYLHVGEAEALFPQPGHTTYCDFTEFEQLIGGSIVAASPQYERKIDCSPGVTRINPG